MYDNFRKNEPQYNLRNCLSTISHYICDTGMVMSTLASLSGVAVAGVSFIRYTTKGESSPLFWKGVLVTLLSSLCFVGFNEIDKLIQKSRNKPNKLEQNL